MFKTHVNKACRTLTILQVTTVCRFPTHAKSARRGTIEGETFFPALYSQCFSSADEPSGKGEQYEHIYDRYVRPRPNVELLHQY
jgi:hypothetical protein